MNVGQDDSRDRPGAIEAPGKPRQRRWLRRVVSVWIVIHLTAIIAAPAATEPSSVLSHEVCQILMPYLGLFYLDHGYHFFAPEPGESSLLTYVAEREDGTTVRRRFPDRATQPRLLYHRYFMLTEHLAGAPEEIQRPWQESYAAHILRAERAGRVTLIQQTHNLPTMERIRDGGRLDDPESYEERELGVFP